MINIYLSVVILNKGLTCLPLRSLFNPASTTSCGVFHISKRILDIGYVLETDEGRVLRQQEWKQFVSCGTLLCQLGIREAFDLHLFVYLRG